MKFVKMHGCGNDYIVMEEGSLKAAPEVLAKGLSDRHFGIGADGLILVCPGKAADFEMCMYNPDGTRAQMCGNGIRCLGKYVWDKGWVNGTDFVVESDKTFHQLKYVGEARQSRPWGESLATYFSVDMGVPVPGRKRKVMGCELQEVCMGNPHAVILTQAPEKIPMERLGPGIENAPEFPDRTNVEFVRILDRGKIWLRVWERGAGETLACGTGACAAGYICMENGLTDEEITVKLLGGELKLARDRGRMLLTGPAETVFEGTIS